MYSNERRIGLAQREELSVQRIKSSWRSVSDRPVSFVFDILLFAYLGQRRCTQEREEMKTLHVFIVRVARFRDGITVPRHKVRTSRRTCVLSAIIVESESCKIALKCRLSRAVGWCWATTPGVIRRGSGARRLRWKPAHASTRSGEDARRIRLHRLIVDRHRT